MMDKLKREKIIKVMNLVSEDVENDAREFDGKPFNGKTMATYMGNHGAAIEALANAIKEILSEEPHDQEDPTTAVKYALKAIKQAEAN